jgi:hypothetical protein
MCRIAGRMWATTRSRMRPGSEADVASRIPAARDPAGVIYFVAYVR